MKYTGTGSKSTPKEVLDEMAMIAHSMRKDGWVLRSGGADGADTAFEAGVPADSGAEIFVPWDGYSERPGAIVEPANKFDQDASRLAFLVNPLFKSARPPVKLQMARAVRMVLGENLDDPVKFLLCWTPDGAESHEDAMKPGGESEAISIAIASHRKIPVVNMKNEGWQDRLEALRYASAPRSSPPVVHKVVVDSVLEPRPDITEKLNAFDEDIEVTYGPSRRFNARG